MFCGGMPIPLSITEIRTPTGDLLDAQDDELVGSARVVAGVLRVAHEIDQDLQHFVLVDIDGRNVGELPSQRHSVTGECTGIQPQAVLDEVDDLDRLGDAAELRVALLHGHRILDVLEIVA